jgi:hypothetical protein
MCCSWALFGKNDNYYCGSDVRWRWTVQCCAGWVMGAVKAMLLSSLLLSLAICHGWARKCERITIHMCQDIGYNLTVMPNLMGHEDQLQADRGVILFRYQTDLSDVICAYVYVCENICDIV